MSVQPLNIIIFYSRLWQTLCDCDKQITVGFRENMSNKCGKSKKSTAVERVRPHPECSGVLFTVWPITHIQHKQQKCMWGVLHIRRFLNIHTSQLLGGHILYIYICFFFFLMDVAVFSQRELTVLKIWSQIHSPHQHITHATGLILKNLLPYSYFLHLTVSALIHCRRKNWMSSNYKFKCYYMLCYMLFESLTYPCNPIYIWAGGGERTEILYPACNSIHKKHNDNI